MGQTKYGSNLQAKWLKSVSVAEEGPHRGWNVHLFTTINGFSSKGIFYRTRNLHNTIITPDDLIFSETFVGSVVSTTLRVFFLLSSREMWHSISTFCPNLYQKIGTTPALVGVKSICCDIISEWFFRVLSLLLTFVPVFRSGNQTQISNCPPISLLSNFSKNFESLLYAHIYETGTGLSEKQHAFVKRRSLCLWGSWRGWAVWCYLHRLVKSIWWS